MLRQRPDNALAALDRARVWLNSEPLTADGLRGRVVLVERCATAVGEGAMAVQLVHAHLRPALTRRPATTAPAV